MWNRAGEMNYHQTKLLADIIKKNRNISSLTETEQEIWRKIDGRFAHTGIDGEIIPDILVFEGSAMEKLKDAISAHSLYGGLLKETEYAFEKTLAILKSNSSEVLRNQLIYCASMQILQIRMMTVHDEVESGKLQIPEQPDKSTVAMCIKVK